MGRKTGFTADAAFDESLEKRVSVHERVSEKAKKAWTRGREQNGAEKSTEYVDIPEFQIERKMDADTGSISYELGQGSRRIETPHLDGVRRLKRRAYYEASGYVHSKIAENEQDNTAVEASHKIEQTGEKAVADLKNMVPSGKRLVRKYQQAMERKAQRDEQERRKFLFQKEIEAQKAGEKQNMFLSKTGKEGAVSGKDTAGFFGKNAERTSRAVSKDAAEEMVKVEKNKQKKRMKKRAVRKAQEENAKRTARTAAAQGASAGIGTTTAGTAVAAGAGTTATAASGVGEYVLMAIGIVLCVIMILFLIIFIIFLFVSQNSYQNYVIGAMYQADPDQIEAAELHYSYMEASLEEYIEDLENQEEGYDGYVIDEAAGIGHNPYTLINYLCAKYGDFTAGDVKEEIEELFHASYTITTWVEDIEVSPPEEEEGEETEEEPEPVTLHILHVKLTKKDLEEIVAERMDAEQTETYELYADSRGGFPFVASPTGDDFRDRISSYYGYRYHPIRGEIRLHRGLDIALPEGTDLHAGIDGTITAAADDPGGYGLYITIKGEDGTEVKYGHMSAFAVSVGQSVKKGDVIGQSGNTGASTGPHVHVEVLQGGQYYNPLFYLDTE